MTRIIVLFLFFFALNFQLAAQSGKGSRLTRKEDTKFQLAESFFIDGFFLRALPLYKELSEAHTDNAYLHYQLGICYLHKSDDKEKAITELEQAKNLAVDLPDIYYWLGRAYHLNYRFDEALQLFEKELQSSDKSTKEKANTQRYIDYCKNAKLLLSDTIDVLISNMKEPLNTPNSEYAPIITIDESMLIFTYLGERSMGGLLDAKFRPDSSGYYYEDIMVSERIGNRWTSPDPIGNTINTNGHDACIALSNDGQTLFIYRSSNEDGGDIYASQLNGQSWTNPERLGPNINTKWWEGSCSLSGDGKLLYFASERPGGFGGRDIYVSEKQADGSWGTAKNLGPSINTIYNDDAPYIHPDGINLFFSSEGHTSMGGYDLFYSVYKNGLWGTPKNIGYPISTTGDERFYVLSADGTNGYYASDQKGGFGQFDLYNSSPGFVGDPPILSLVLGFVTKDNNPVEASFNVTNAETGEQYGKYKSNGSSGKYLIALKPGNKYKVAIEVEGADTYYEYVNVKNVDTYVSAQKDYQYITSTDSNGVTKVMPMITDSSESLQRKIDDQLRQARAEQVDQVFEARVYKSVLKKYGDVYDSCITYMVELGTYESASLFNPSKINDMGAITSSVTPEGYTRYSMGSFKTLLDAELFRTRIAQRDSVIGSNSEVTVLTCKGIRQTIPVFYKSEYKRQGYIPRRETYVVRSQNNGIMAKTSNADPVYDQLVEDKGSFTAEGLSYKLEIGAVRDSNDFKLGYLSKYGKIEKKVYPDGTIRYQMGPWATLKEAEDFKAMLISKDSALAKSIVTVFFFGERKSVKDFFAQQSPCNPQSVDLAWFKDKSLNDPSVYKEFLNLSGNYCTDGLIYKVQIGAYRKPWNFKYPQVADLGSAEVLGYPDSITRFTMREFKTIKEAEAFRQICISRGITDSWITAIYKGERKTLEELIDADFYGKRIQ